MRLIRRLIFCLYVVLTAQTTAAQVTSKQAPAGAPSKTGPESLPVSAEPSQTTANFGDWILRCQHGSGEAASDGRICEIDQILIVQGQQAPVAEITVTRTDAKSPSHLNIALPVNISVQIAPHIQMDAPDGEGFDLAWRRCTAASCVADRVIADEVIKLWRSHNDRGRLLFTNASGQPLTLLFSFRGFSQAMDALIRK